MENTGLGFLKYGLGMCYFSSGYFQTAFEGTSPENTNQTG